jgi:hypothetical protein
VSAGSGGVIVKIDSNDRIEVLVGGEPALTVG